MPNHGHGSFWNPLNATGEPLVYDPEIFQKYTNDFINGNLKVVGVGEPQTINAFDDVEIAPRYTGWGMKDNTLGINYYKMTDELHEKLCPSWENLSEQLNKQESFGIAFHRSGPYGPRPFGCGALLRTQMNGTFSDIPELGSIYFNSKFKAANELGKKMKEWNSMYVSSFYSNFKSQRLTSPTHNAMVPSVAVTCSGNKWWVFSRPRAVSKYGARTFEGAAFMRGIDENEEQFVVHTGPGSIITFPPYWAHWVMTKPGPSFMYTLRLKYPGNLLLNLITRMFSERVTLYHMLPGWIKGEALKSAFNQILNRETNTGSSSFEIADKATDIHGGDCPNKITKEELEGLFAKCKSVQKEY